MNPILFQSLSRIVKSSSRGQINTADKFHDDVTISLSLLPSLPQTRSRMSAAVSRADLNSKHGRVHVLSPGSYRARRAVTNSF